MRLAFVPAGGRYRRGAGAAFSIFCALLLAGALQQAKAGTDFTGYYAFNNFQLSNSGGLFPNGTAYSSDPGTLILTGTHDGSDLPGITDFTILAAAAGLFQFDWVFTTADVPTYEYAGSVVSGAFTQFADTSGESGSFSAPVLGGDVIGFAVGSVDNIGGAGVLTVTNFSAPVPEPGNFHLLLIGAAALALSPILRRIRFRRAPYSDA